MRNLTVILLLIAFCGFTTATAVAERTIGELQFSENFNELIEEAQESEKAIVLKFYTDWCHWCKVMDDSTFPDPYVQKFLKNFSLGMINAEVDTNVAEQFGVRSYPTTILLKWNGEEIDRMVGYYPPEEFVTQVLDSYAGKGTLDYYLEKLLDKSQSPELNYEVGQKYRWRGDYNAAREYFEKTMAADKNNKSGYAVQAWFNIGHMQYKLRNYLAAIDVWRKVPNEFSSDPVVIDAEIMIAYCFQKAEDFESAKEEYNKFLAKYPDTEEREWIEKQFAKMNGTQ